MAAEKSRLESEYKAASVQLKAAEVCFYEYRDTYYESVFCGSLYAVGKDTSVLCLEMGIGTAKYSALISAG